MSSSLVIIDNTGATPKVNGVEMTVEEVAKTTGVDLTLATTPEVKPVSAAEVSTPEATTPVSKGVALRLSDGSTRPLTKGRRPIGSVVIDAQGNALTTPVVSKRTTSAPKNPVMIRLADGTERPRARGRQPKGSTVIE